MLLAMLAALVVGCASVVQSPAEQVPTEQNADTETTTDTDATPGAESTVEAETTRDTTDDADTIVEAVPGEEAEQPVVAEQTDGGDFTLVLPEAPEEQIGHETTRVPGTTLTHDRVVGPYYIWCEDLDLNSNPDVAQEDGVYAMQGEVFGRGEGAGWIMNFSAEKFSPGDVVPLPSESWELIFFYVAAVPDLSPIVWNLNSDQEESFGTITLHEIPCQGNGDSLRFTIDGGIGSETYPGYIAWADISGSFTGTVTGPPPDP